MKNCGCHGPCNCGPHERCHPPTASMLGTLTYLAGIDSNGCSRLQAVGDFIDICKLGQRIPAGMVNETVGRDLNGCLVYENACNLTKRCETPWNGTSQLGSLIITEAGPAGHQPFLEVNVAPTQNGEPNQLSIIPGQGVYVPRGANALVCAPLVGNGSNAQCLDINFSLLSPQDLCDLGQVIPGGVVAAAVGLNSGGCLVAENMCGIVIRCETPVSPIGSPAINFTATGQSDHTLSISLIMSPDPDQVGTIRANGLYVPRGANANVCAPLIGNGSSAQCLDIDFSLLSPADLCALGQVIPTGSGATMMIASDPSGCLIKQPICAAVVNCETPITPVDSPTVDLSVSGVSDHTLTAAVKVSSFPGQQLTVDPLGLYVPRGANANVCAPLVGNGSDATCLDINFALLDATDLCNIGQVVPFGTLEHLVGTDANCLRKEDIRSAVLRGETPFVVNDTATVNLTQLAQPNGHSVQADVKISPNNNLIGVDANGLSVTCANVIACVLPAIPADKFITSFVISGNTAIITRSDGVTFTQTIPLPLDINVQSFSLAGSTMTITETDGSVHVVTLPADTVPVSMDFFETTGQFTLTLSNGVVLSTTFQLCQWLQSQITTGVAGAFGTSEFLGRDCQWHLLPAVPAPSDPCIVLSTKPNGLPATYGVSEILGRDCQWHLLPTTDVCAQLDTLPLGGPIVYGTTVLLGDDCQWHQVPTICDTLQERPFIATPLIPGTTSVMTSECDWVKISPYYSVSVQATTADIVYITVPGTGGVTVPDVITATATLMNPSLDKDMVVDIFTGGGTLFNNIPDACPIGTKAVAALNPRVIINGIQQNIPGLTNVGSTTVKLTPVGAGQITYDDSGPTQLYTIILAPGASVTVEYHGDIRVLEAPVNPACIELAAQKAFILLSGRNTD